MIATFTGTQHGMQTCQLHMLREWVQENIDEMEEFHHGVANGADLQAHLLVYDMVYHASPWALETVMHYHPSNLFDKQADIRAFKGTWHFPKKPLDRNHVMVDSSDVVLAAPYQNKEVLRSGTWATVRYARKSGKEVIMLPRWEPNKGKSK